VVSGLEIAWGKPAVVLEVPAAATAWLNRLASVSRSEVQRLLDEVPNKRMSAISKSFTLELLEENKRRLLKGLVA
jgi:putative SOS response-associated peptidase YedK